MKGYCYIDRSGKKLIKEGITFRWDDDMDYATRHTMSNLEWGYYWENKMAWEAAKDIRIYEGCENAFTEGAVEYKLFGMYAIPVFNEIEPTK